MLELIRDLQTRLEAKAEPATRRWWEQYLKGEARFRGVKMAAIRQCVDDWLEDYPVVNVLGPDGRFALVNGLIEQPITEDKLAGVLYLVEHLIPKGEVRATDRLPAMGRWFDDGHLSDWNAVDWTGVKALATLVESEGETAGRAVLAWHDARCVWRARAGLVAFANLSSRGDTLFPGFVDAVLEASAEVIQRPERFAKTAVGWTLRGLGEAAPRRLESFTRQHLAEFSTEALRQAVKRLPPDAAGKLLTDHKALTR